MKENNIWFGLVEIKPMNENTIIENSLGAYVNVAYRADTKKEFIKKIETSFLENDYKVIDVDDIENETNISVDNVNEAEKIELLNDLIEEGYDFSWGVFHTYDEEE